MSMLTFAFLMILTVLVPWIYFRIQNGRFRIHADGRTENSFLAFYVIEGERHYRLSGYVLTNKFWWVVRILIIFGFLFFYDSAAANTITETGENSFSLELRYVPTDTAYVIVVKKYEPLPQIVVVTVALILLLGPIIFFEVKWLKKRKLKK